MAETLVLTKRPVGARRIIALAMMGLVVVAIAGGCATRTPTEEVTPVDALRISQVSGLGDPARRASLRLVEQGLEDDVRGAAEEALSSYERALQVDPTNPYAYLALARHHIDAMQPDSAYGFVEQAGALFDAQGGRTPEVDVHLVGLRGAALLAGAGPASQGGSDDLADAAQRAPDVWGDGYLSAEELL